MLLVVLPSSAGGRGSPRTSAPRRMDPEKQLTRYWMQDILTTPPLNQSMWYKNTCYYRPSRIVRSCQHFKYNMIPKALFVVVVVGGG